MTDSLPQFLAVDGIDGVGKSTQIQRLSALLDELGLPHSVTRDPGTSRIGTRIRSLLLDGSLAMHRRTEALLFMASRCEMVEGVIRPALEHGESIITDRFLLANVVYQSVADDDHEAVDPELLWSLGELANQGLRPDLTILLDMPAGEAMKRIDRPADRMESRGVDYMEAVRQAFLEQLPRSSESTVVINANQAPDRVATDIRQAVTQFLERD